VDRPTLLLGRPGGYNIAVVSLVFVSPSEPVP